MDKFPNAIQNGLHPIDGQMSREMEGEGKRKWTRAGQQKTMDFVVYIPSTSALMAGGETELAAWIDPVGLNAPLELQSPDNRHPSPYCSMAHNPRAGRRAETGGEAAITKNGNPAPYCPLESQARDPPALVSSTVHQTAQGMPSFVAQREVRAVCFVAMQKLQKPAGSLMADASWRLRNTGRQQGLALMAPCTALP